MIEINQFLKEHPELAMLQKKFDELANDFIDKIIEINNPEIISDCKIDFYTKKIFINFNASWEKFKS